MLKTTKKTLIKFKNYITKEEMLKSSSAFLIALTLREVMTSFVKNIVNPLISLVFKIEDLETFKAKIPGTATSLPIGSFIEAVFNFLILSFTIFLIVELSVKSNILAKSQEDDQILKLEENNEYLKKQLDISEKQLKLMQKMIENQDKILNFSETKKQKNLTPKVKVKRKNKMG